MLWERFSKKEREQTNKSYFWVRDSYYWLGDSQASNGKGSTAQNVQGDRFLERSEPSFTKSQGPFLFLWLVEKIVTMVLYKHFLYFFTSCGNSNIPFPFSTHFMFVPIWKMIERQNDLYLQFVFGKSEAAYHCRRVHQVPIGVGWRGDGRTVTSGDAACQLQ